MHIADCSATMNTRGRGEKIWAVAGARESADDYEAINPADCSEFGGPRLQQLRIATAAGPREIFAGPNGLDLYLIFVHPRKLPVKCSSFKKQSGIRVFRG